MRHAGLVLSCEHAAWQPPPGWSHGLSDAVLSSHVGWDHGALEIARRLAERLGVPLLAGASTRLYVDLNRAESSSGVIPAVSFGVEVPGNAGLTPEEREARLERVHRPYRRRLLEAVSLELAQAGRCLHVPVHSFTPELGGQRRQYELGVLFDPARAAEAALAEALLVGLQEAGIDARANEPYLGTDDGVTAWLRTVFPDPDYAGIEIECSHAVTEAPGGPERIAEALSRLLLEE
jgi:predicted N-formylglutamate amidohydrolase